MVRRDSDLGFAPPDPFEMIDVSYYAFKRRRQVRESELLATDDVFSALDGLGYLRNPLTEVGITAFDSDGNEVGGRYELREYLQAEVPGDDASSRFVLSGGIGFRVADDWVQEVNEYVRNLPDYSSTLDFPEWKETLQAAIADGRATPEDVKKSAEGVYNDKLAVDRSYHLLDKRTVSIGGPNQKIEICDLLTQEKQLICIKRATRSSALSHLFAQASVSASLIPEPQYQRRMMAAYQTFAADAIYDGPRGWTFVYAIATDKEGRVSETMFFFSKVNLMTHAKDIKSRGFEVALAKICIDV